MPSSTGSRPQGRAGGRCCRSIRPTSSARRTPPRRRSRRGAACSPIRRRAVEPSELRRVRARQGRLDRRLGRVRGWRRARGAGAVRARVARAARLCGRTRRPRDRRRADLRRGRRLRPSRASRALPALDELVAGAPPDALNDAGPDVGQPALRLAGAGRRRSTAGGSSGCAARSPRRRLPASTTSAASPPTGPFPRPPRPPVTAGGAGPGRGPLPCRRGTRSGRLPVIAEDLGVITDDVLALRDELGFPGMVVLLWSRLGPADNPHRLENHRVHQVVYTSTHDTDTLAGLPGDADAWPLVERALSSRAALAIVPAQDVLGARERGADEPSRRGRRSELAVAPRAGPADGGHAARLRAAAEASGRV